VTLDVDGKIIEAPNVETIAREFDSIKGGGASLVVFSRDENNSLTAAGTPAEGWSGLLQDANGVSRVAQISSPLRQEKIIQIFQSYARGDELWEKEFQWNAVDEEKWPVKRIAAVGAILLAIIVIARSCSH
jgi:hypothetical protein